MAEEKPSVDKKNSRHLILESINFLFYVSKVFGMVPYSMSDYITKRRLKVSQLGNILCVVSCIHYAVQYHVLNTSSVLVKDSESSIGTLTTVIGVFIIYMEPLMMSIDALASLINQKSLITVFDRLREIDDKLGKENISLNYRVITRYSIIFMVVAFVGEVTLGIFNLLVFQTEFFSWGSLWWLISCAPLFCNGVAKTWFLILILLVQQRLQAINNYLNDTKKIFFERKLRQVIATHGSHLRKDNLFIEKIGYLEKEIFATRNMKIKSGNAWNWVDKSSVTNKVNDISVFAPKPRGFIDVAPYDPNRQGESLNLIDCSPDSH